MTTRTRRSAALKLLALAAAATFAIPSPVAARDPSPGASPDSGVMPPGGGIVPGGKATPEKLGYTVDYAKQKQAEADRLVPSARTKMKSGMSTLGVQDTISDSLVGWRQIHQYTNYWCLSAMVQSILQYKFGGWANGTLAFNKAKQQAIYNVIGTNEDNAVQFLNDQFEIESIWFRYVQTNTPDVPTFIQHMKYDITFADFPEYARAQVASRNYVWYQASAGYHASAAVGYQNSGATVDVSDPFFSPTSRAGCVRGYATWGYDPNQLYGCVYGAYSTSKYWLAETGEWW